MLLHTQMQNLYSSKYIRHHSNPTIHQLNSTKSHHLMFINVVKGNNEWKCKAFSGLGMLAAAVVLSTPAPSEDTLSNIPQTLSGGSCETSSSDGGVECEEMKVKRIQKPKSRNAEGCTSKCVTTCTRGGDEGPLNLRGPIVVFKQGFRSRQYCLVECSDICNLLDDVGKGRH